MSQTYTTYDFRGFVHSRRSAKAALYDVIQNYNVHAPETRLFIDEDNAGRLFLIQQTLPDLKGERDSPLWDAEESSLGQGRKKYKALAMGRTFDELVEHCPESIPIIPETVRP